MSEARSEILIGDCRATLATLPARSVHCCVTSPPYFALRSYLPAGHESKHLEMGSEPTPAEFVRGMVEVFGAVRRVLRDDGCLFVNIGDSYAQNGGAHGGRDDNQLGVGQRKAHENGNGDQAARRAPAGNKAGDLLGIPWLLADALKADGWYLRCDIVWAKKSPMPESINGWRWTRCRVKVNGGERGSEAYRNGSNGHKPQQDHNGKDFKPSSDWQPCPGCDKCRATNGLVLRRGKWRPTRSHEFVFMFAKSEQYFCDAQAVQEAASGGTHPFGSKLRPPKEAAGAAAGNGHADFKRYAPLMTETRNPRSVFSLSSEPCKLAHFATYPTKLILPLIKAATSSAGCCPECGACFAPIVESERVPTRPGLDNQIDESGMSNRDPQRHVKRTTVKGYLPTCKCNAGEAVPCTVLDPFSGAGTTGVVCKRLGLDYIGCELNPEYAAMARKRIDEDRPKPATVKRFKVLVGQRELF